MLVFYNRPLAKVPPVRAGFLVKLLVRAVNLLAKAAPPRTFFYLEIKFLNSCLKSLEALSIRRYGREAIVLGNLSQQVLKPAVKREMPATAEIEVESNLVKVFNSCISLLKRHSPMNWL